MFCGRNTNTLQALQHTQSQSGEVNLINISRWCQSFVNVKMFCFFSPHFTVPRRLCGQHQSCVCYNRWSPRAAMNPDLSCCQDTLRTRPWTVSKCPWFCSHNTTQKTTTSHALIPTGHPNIAHFTVGALANQDNRLNYPRVTVSYISGQDQSARFWF